MFYQDSGLELLDKYANITRKSLVLKERFRVYAQKKLHEAANVWRKKRKKRKKISNEEITIVGIHHRMRDHLIYEVTSCDLLLLANLGMTPIYILSHSSHYILSL